MMGITVSTGVFIFGKVELTQLLQSNSNLNHKINFALLVLEPVKAPFTLLAHLL